MQRSWDGRSFAIGAFAGAVCVAAFGAAQTPTPEVGRFQISAARAGSTNSDAYVVDTVTGQVWSNDSGHREKAFYVPKLGASELPPK